MVKKFIFFFLATGEPAYISVPEYNGLYVDKTVYGDTIAVELPDGIADATALETLWWDGAIIRNRLSRPSHYHSFNKITAQWEMTSQSIIDYANAEISKLNFDTNKFILSRYTLENQANIHSRWNKLFETQITDPANFTTAMAAEKEAINAIWQWIDAIKSAYAVATDAMGISTNIDNINALSVNFRSTYLV